MDNIILIGMPGCGKSTCGVLAAKLMCKKFIDTDLIIQQGENMRLQQIINERGSEYFAQCEEKYVSTVDEHNCVIATGGSVVYSEKAMEHLRSIGKVIYLKISLENMKKRIRNLSTRGILLKDGYTLDDMYEERCALYEKYADEVINCDDKHSVEQTAAMIAGVHA